MSAFKSIVSNTAARTLTEIINRLGAAVFWVMVARKLGVNNLGVIAFALAMFTLFSSISTMGLGSVVIRDVARDKTLAGLYFSQTLILGMFFSLICAAGMIISTIFLNPHPDTIQAVIIMALAIFPASGFYWSKSILSSFEKMGYIAIARSAENAFKVLFGLILLLTGAGIREMALVIMLSKVLSFVICFSYAADKVAPPVWLYNFSIFKYLTKQIPSFSLITLFNSLFWTLPVIMLTKLHGEAEAGIFSAAFKLVELFIAFALAYGQALFPVIARYSFNNFKLFESLCKSSIKYITLFTLAAAAGGFVMADKIILLVYGTNMPEAVPVFRAAIGMIIPFGIIPVLAYALISQNLQKYDLRANLAGVGVIFVLNLLLIPGMGAAGAAIALFVAGLCFLTIEYYYVYRTLFRIRFTSGILKPVLGVFIMMVIVFLFRDFNILIPISAGALLYLAFLWLSKTISKIDINYFKYLRSV